MASHDYFNALVAMPECRWKFSLRSQQQLLDYRNSLTSPPAITYDPTHDIDPHAQDAAKVPIPAFVRHKLQHTLGAAVGPDDTVLYVPDVTTSYQKPTCVRIDAEIMEVTDPDGSGPLPSVDVTEDWLYVKRGQFGTLKAAHATGAPIWMSTNNVQNQVRLPIGTTGGHVYLFTWDWYITDSWLHSGMTSQKTFQLATGSSDSRWIEARGRWAGGASCCEEKGVFNPATDVGIFDARSYNALGGPAVWDPATSHLMGPGPPRIDPVMPKAKDPLTFVLKPNRWNRIWVRVDQRHNDYTPFDMWIADEQRDAVQMYAGIPTSIPIRDGQRSITKLWGEFNTSTTEFTRGDFRDLVAYWRNVAVLQDPPDVHSLLVRPEAGVPIPPPGERPSQPSAVTFTLT